MCKTEKAQSPRLSLLVIMLHYYLHMTIKLGIERFYYLKSVSARSKPITVTCAQCFNKMVTYGFRLVGISLCASDYYSTGKKKDPT